jgi:hypothetical protein
VPNIILPYHVPLSPGEKYDVPFRGSRCATCWSPL